MPAAQLSTSARALSTGWPEAIEDITRSTGTARNIDAAPPNDRYPDARRSSRRASRCPDDAGTARSIVRRRRYQRNSAGPRHKAMRAACFQPAALSLDRRRVPLPTPRCRRRVSRATQTSEVSPRHPPHVRASPAVLTARSRRWLPRRPAPAEASRPAPWPMRTTRPIPSKAATIANIASAAPSTGSASNETGPGSTAIAAPSNASGVTAQLTTGIATAFASGDTIDNW